MLADPAWEFRKASLWEETTKWSIKAQMGSLRWGAGVWGKREEDAPQEKKDKQTTQRGECPLVREPTARLACQVNFAARLTGQKQWLQLHKEMIDGLSPHLGVQTGEKQLK